MPKSNITSSHKMEDIPSQDEQTPMKSKAQIKKMTMTSILSKLMCSKFF